MRKCLLKSFCIKKKRMKEAEEVLASKKCKEKILDKAIIILARSTVLCDDDGTRRPGHSVYSLHN